MKKTSIVKNTCFLFLYSFSFAACDAATTKSVFKPTVYADISKDAQNAAVSTEGARGLFGIVLGQNAFDGGMNGSATTGNSMGIIGLAIGAEYMKGFRKTSFLIGLEGEADVCLKKKKEGLASTVNNAYFNLQRQHHAQAHCKLENSWITPNFAVKVGYMLSKYHIMVFGKAGISILSGTFTYRQAAGGAELNKIKLTSYPILLGIGLERKIDNKWGVLAEVTMSLKRKTSKKIAINGVDQTHDVHTKQMAFRLMATVASPK